jgi:hypothetical protein
VCALRLEGAAVREGGITSFSVDASESRDPDSLEQIPEFRFQVDCRGQNGAQATALEMDPDATNLTERKRTITVSDPSRGIPITCTVIVTPRDVRGGESSCMVTTTLQPYAIGCDGKLYDPPGTAPKIDLCGVCGGNDSCGVRSCSVSDHLETQLQLDGGAAGQRAFGLSLAWRLTGWGGKNKQMKALVARFRLELSKAYIDAWQAAYRIPSRTLSNCGDSVLCSSRSTAPAVADFVKKSQRFIGIQQRIIKLLEPFAKSGTKKEAARRAQSLKNAVANTQRLHAQNVELTKEFPLTTEECRG